MTIELDPTWEDEPKQAGEIAEDVQESLDLDEGGDDTTQDDDVVEGEIEGEATALTVSHSQAIETPESLASLATEEQMEAAIRRIVNRTKALKEFKAAMLSLTNVRDWYAHEGEGEEDGIPYLAESGSEKIINAFEIEVEHDGGVRNDMPPDIGGYEFVYQGRMRALVFSDIWYPVVGSRWSDDGFFTRGGTRIADPGDVRKAAWTNFMNRGIKTVCGLKTITWDELERMPGLENLRNRCVKITYSGGAKGPAPEPGEISDIEKGPHIKVKIDKEDMESRNTIKKLPAKDRAWNKSPGCFYWVVRYTKKNLSMVMDLHAVNSAVKYKLANVPKEDLP
jgi:hypothetical protein